MFLKCASVFYRRVVSEVITNKISRVETKFQFDAVFFLQADLIHMGAKYSPCMRDDENVRRAILNLKAIENETACCVLNDGSGCVQTVEEKCSVSIHQFCQRDGIITY
jgi:hypothetical protein